MIREKNNPIVLFLAIGLLLLTGCMVGSKTTHYQCKTITVVSYLDMVKEANGELITIQDSFKVSYLDNIVLFHVPYQFLITKDEKKGDTVEVNVISETTLYKYYIYKEGNAYGYRYDSLTAKNGKKFLVDSFLTAEAYGKSRFFYETNDSLVSSSVFKDEQIEKHVPKIRYDETYPDTSYFYFKNQFDNVNFTFSKELEKTRKKKLVKVLFTYNSIPKGIYPFEIPRRVLSFEIKAASLGNSKEIVDFLKRATKESLY